MSVANTIPASIFRKPLSGRSKSFPRPWCRIACMRRAQCICSRADLLSYTSDNGALAFFCGWMSGGIFFARCCADQSYHEHICQSGMTHIMANGNNVQGKKTCVVEIECETSFLPQFVWSPCTVVTIQQYRHWRYDTCCTQEGLGGLHHIYSVLKIMITIMSTV